MDIAVASDLAEDCTDRIFVFWFGEDMSDRRRRCYESLARSECRIHLVVEDSLAGFVLPGRPLHPAFGHLSPVHRSDYLRAYFMHHYGGGYSDIKMTSASWRPAFAALRNSDALGAGYPEVAGGLGRFHRSQVQGKYFYLDREVSRLKAHLLYRHHSFFHRRLLGNGAFAYRPRTEFTGRWLALVERRLDFLQPLLAENPARYGREKPGENLGDGPSRYPVPWSFLLGDILAPLVMKYHRKVLQVIPPPSFENYQ